MGYGYSYYTFALLEEYAELFTKNYHDLDVTYICFKNNPLTERRRLKRQWPTDLSLA
jgi:hypothetical protein